MPTPSEVTGLISAVGPETIEKFCRLKFPAGQFDRCGSGAGAHLRIDYSDATNPSDTAKRALRELLDLTVDRAVQVVGRFLDPTAGKPVLVYAVPMKGEIGSRSSRKKQADFARILLGNARDDLGHYRSDWSRSYTTGLFFFYDQAGNFRMSLIESGEKRFRRYTFFVEHDTTGAKNRTFRYRMTNAASSDKAARGELDKWNGYHDIKAAFSVETLTKEFYQNLFDWYNRACQDLAVEFPNNIDNDADNHDRKPEHLIRLITRTMFVWFIKQKDLVPNDLFEPSKLTGILKSFDPKQGDAYYRAILQNLFFATLNSEIADRAFATAGTFDENREHFDVKTLYRYRDEFAIGETEVLELFRRIPFLNGGLFECLDRGRNYADGFSREPKNVAHIPNAYFFGEDEKSLGLITLLNRYHFTVDENAPGDEDVALDPELLGKVFENLLGAYNPETQVAARNATGSFYTPREIVNYMVDESLIAHLGTRCGAQHEAAIRALFAEGAKPADAGLCRELDKALVTARILDPACGSGAFPMGILLRMVEVLRILRGIADSDTLYELKLELIENCIYGGDIQCIAVQISKLRFFISLVCEQTRTEDPAKNFGINTLPNLETKFVAADSLIGLPAEAKNVLDLCSGNIVELKKELWDIRHRHFQARTYREKKELRRLDEQKRGEIKAAVRESARPDRERLEGLVRDRAKVAEPRRESLVAGRPEALDLFAEFAAPKQKAVGLSFDANEKARKDLDALIERERKKTAVSSTVVDAIAESLASWDPYDQNSSAGFSDPEWMFNVRDGFDVVIGNPPYVRIQTLAAAKPLYAERLKATYSTARKGSFDLYVVFVERGLQLLETRGQLAFILPHKFFNAQYGSALRELLANGQHLRHVVHFGDQQVFPGATTYVCLLFLAKAGADACRWARIADLAAWSSGAQFGETQLPAGAFSGAEWNFAGVSADKLLAKVQQAGPRLLDLPATMSRGHSTGADPIFIVDAATTSIESALLRIPIFAEDFGRYRFKPSQRYRVLFPYMRADGSVRPLAESRLSAQFPIGYEHLRMNSAALGKRKTNADWFLFSAARNLELHEQAIIVAPLLAERGRFALVPAELAGTLCPMASGGFTIAFDASEVDPRYLLGLLNSKLLYWVLSRTSNMFRAGWITCTKQYVGELPIALDERPVPGPVGVRAAIVDLVAKILLAKANNESADTGHLEDRIDEIVYQLYGLAPDEVVLVESATAQSAVTKSSLSPVGAASDPDASPSPPPTPTRKPRTPAPDTDLDL